MGGDADGRRAEDRASAAGLRGGGRARVRAGGGPLSEHALTLDTGHAGLTGAIAVYRIEGPESTLVDPGPSPSLPTLLDELAAAGADVHELRHLVLTHVHLDHAGAAGDLVRMCPNLTVHVHVDGAPYLVDPERLVASTRRTFGEAYDELYGEVKPIPAERMRVWRPGETAPVGGRGATSLRAIPSPGHIAHHLGFLDERDGTLYCGDALGLWLAPGGAVPAGTVHVGAAPTAREPVLAPTPPPAVDLATWFITLDTLDAIGPERIAPTHFGMSPRGGVAATRARIREFRSELLRVATRVRAALEIDDDEADAERYEAEIRERLADHRDRDWVDRYFDAFSAANDYRGVVRYLTKNPDWRPPRGADEGRD